MITNINMMCIILLQGYIVFYKSLIKININSIVIYKQEYIGVDVYV